MYNPYNWKIVKQKCILDELSSVSVELDMERIKYNALEKELLEVKEKIVKLEKEKVHIVNNLMENP